MPRPRRTPDSHTTRLVAYVAQVTKDRLYEIATARQVPVGQVLDDTDFGTLDSDIRHAPLVDLDDFNDRLANGIVRRPVTEPPPARRKHAWAANSVGVNVCSACGVQKRVSTNPNCPGGTE